MRVNKYDVDEKNTNFSLKNLKRALKYSKKYKKQLLLVFFIHLSITLISLIYAKIIQYGIDNITKKMIFESLVKFFIISASLQVVVVLLHNFRNKKLTKVNENVIEDLKNDLFTHLQYLSSNYYDTRPHGKILVRLTEYSENVSTLITNGLIDTILQLLSITLTLIFMIITNISLTLITLLGVIILTIIFSFTTKIKRKLKHQINNKKSNMNAYFYETIKGLDTTKIFNRSYENEKIHDSLTDAFFEAYCKYIKYSNISWSSTAIVSNTVQIAIYTIGIFYLFPSITLGTIVAMGSYSTRFWNPIKNLFLRMDEFIESMTSLERILETLDEPITIKNNENPVKKEIEGNIEFKDVVFQYNDDKIILDNISFKIKQGQKVAIVGETGSGKTTIANLIARFYDINKGNIYIDNTDIKDYDLNCLRRQVSIMQQDNYLFTDTIMNNLKYGNINISDKEIINLCKKIDLDDWIKEFANGYETVLENHGNTLSDGEKQLLSYIRVLINDPKILVLDEATSKIDVRTENLIQNKINNLIKDKTTITIAHRLSTIVNSDIILFIKDKKILEIGNHQELMKKKGEYYKLFSSQDNLI
ncbi:MAG: ABC transporter ATP-binding protein [Bacilli bacterium]|nr:ABC transporter ATP-binding protein [Bacilli bacterium]